MLPFSLPHTPGKCNAFEGSSQLSSNFTWGSAQVRETAFLGSLPQTLLGKLRTNQGNCFLGEFTSNSTGEAPHKPGKLLSWGVYLKFYQESSAQTPGQAEPIFTRPRVLRFRLRACAPINRQSPRRASSRLERGALWRSLAQPCARNPRNVSV